MQILLIRKNGTNVCEQGRLARSFTERTRGLMFRDNWEGMDGLLIESCNSIHMFFVRFPIVAVFLDSENKVVKVLNPIKPWRITPPYFNAKKVLELPFPNRIEFKEGEQLEVQCIS